MGIGNAVEENAFVRRGTEIGDECVVGIGCYTEFDEKIPSKTVVYNARGFQKKAEIKRERVRDCFRLWFERRTWICLRNTRNICKISFQNTIIRQKHSLYVHKPNLNHSNY